jgi:hypothetical protein
MNAIKPTYFLLAASSELLNRSWIGHTMHAKHDSQLLDAFRNKRPRWYANLVLLQMVDDLFHPIDVFRKLGIVRLVSLNYLFYYM